jgi:predicted DNA-binding protein (UPF0278 family)
MLEFFRVRKIVKKGILQTIEDLKEKGLISIYLAGKILSDDQVYDSQIDLFGIVASEFDMQLEEILNSKFEEEEGEKYGGISVRFRAIPICSLEGGELKGIVLRFKPERMLQRLPFFKYKWGKKFNFKKDFPHKPMTLRNEARMLMREILDEIRDLRNEREEFPFRDLPKHVIELVRVEAQKEHGFDYDPSYKKLSKHLEKEENHIIHKATALRMKKSSRLDIMIFCDHVEKYIEDLKKRVDEWY